MVELKTKKTRKSPDVFLRNVEDEKKRNDMIRIYEFLKEATKMKPAMWGDSIIGFGDYHYQYPTGRDGKWFYFGLSPRKQSITIYFMSYLEEMSDLLEKLGKHKIGKGCLYVKKLEDIDLEVLKEMVDRSIIQLDMHKKE